MGKSSPPWQPQSAAAVTPSAYHPVRVILHFQFASVNVTVSQPMQGISPLAKPRLHGYNSAFSDAARDPNALYKK
jgi:hypothetical protein